MPNANGKYYLSRDGIVDYYENAIKKIKINSKHSFAEDEIIINNFFDNIPKHLNPMNLNFNEANNRDYHVALKNIEDETSKIELWHLRLIHVCNVLIVCSLIDGADEIELGIFGSESPSSDIDIGVSYKSEAKINKNTIKLSEIVKTFEEVFSGPSNTNNTGLKYSSLDLDVEMYADYFILRGNPFIETNELSYKYSLPYVVAGMLKNYAQSFIDSSPEYCDIRRKIKLIESNTCDSKKLVNIVSKAKVDDIIHLPAYLEGNNNYINYFNKKSNKSIHNELKNDIKSSLDRTDSLSPVNIITEYLSSNYKTSTKKYYKLLNIVHDKYIEIFNLDKIDVNMYADLSKKICHALVYRAESYQSPATIYHVVYSMQAKPEKNKLFQLQQLITKHGYKLSLLEQIGFQNRFFNEYNNKDVSEDIVHKFQHKIEKYNKRIKDAISNMGTTYNISLGGKTKRCHKKRRNCKTRKKK